MSTLRIGLAHRRQTGDLDTNAMTIFRMIEEAARQDVQVLCFPETDGGVSRRHRDAGAGGAG